MSASGEWRVASWELRVYFKMKKIHFKSVQNRYSNFCVHTKTKHHNQNQNKKQHLKISIESFSNFLFVCYSTCYNTYSVYFHSRDIIQYNTSFTIYLALLLFK